MSAWRFAVERYAEKGVGDILVELQDRHGQSAAFLLWRLWRLDGDLAPEVLERAAALARSWEVRVTGPLRSARRALRRPGRVADPIQVAALRAELSAVELASERLLLESLAALPASPSREPPCALTALIEATAIWGGGAPRERLHALVLAITAVGDPR